MIAHLRGREEALEPFGWKQEDAEWVAMVCLHSGMFTRAQYMAYFNAHPQQAARFVQCLVDLKLAVEEPIPVIRPENRTKACRITYKGIYRELGVPNIRHRRFADPAGYLRRLLSLDYVIDHAELGWLPTEDEKVWYCKHLGIGKDRLPKRLYAGAAGNVTRYFPLKLPVASGTATTFVYVDPGNGTSTELRHWGRAHKDVWNGIRKHGIKVHVAAIGATVAADKRARAVLEGWARDRKRVEAGSPHEEELQEERDEVARAVRTADAAILERYGGFDRTSRRYVELKKMLAKPLMHDIRIDTFEVWRSERIFPEGVKPNMVPV